MPDDTAVMPEPDQAPTVEVPSRSAGSGLPEGWLDPSCLRVVREIGQGGMATIYLAQLALPAGPDGSAQVRDVALKVMHPHLATDPSLVRRFEHEVRSQIGLKDPAIVELIGWGRDPQGRLFMAMELVDGCAVKEIVPAGRRMPPDVAAQIARCTLRGLAVAHARGLVHRDVKPANLMVTRQGHVKVADFGISKAADMTKLTSTGNVIGTPAYMSPEQALARPLDARSDLFSVGVMLYEMIVGENPFQTGNPATTLSRVVHHHQRPVMESLPQTPALLEELIDALLQKDPEKRLASAAAALELLERCIAEADLACSPEVVAQYAADPATTSRRLDARRAQRHFERGRKAHAIPGGAEAAAWELYLATLLDPSHADARTWLEQVSRERGYSLSRKGHPRLDQLEAQLAQDPDNLHLVLQLAKLHKAQGNFLQVIHYYRRARALRPPDNYTKAQIDTLIAAPSATLLDGAGVFETKDHVPVRVRPRPAAAEPARAESVGEFLRSAWGTTWVRLGAGAAGLAIVVGGVGLLFDRAVVASQPASARADGASDAEIDRQLLAYDRALQHSSAGQHADAERAWRRFLEENPESGLRSEAMFRLGDALEGQGRRDEALEVHGDNATRHLDDWALSSREHRGELFLLRGDATSARAEFAWVARESEGDRKSAALVQSGESWRREGRTIDAIAETREAVEAAETPKARDLARLALAGILEESGDAEGARELYEQVRATTDHRSESFRRAQARLEKLPFGERAAASLEEAASMPSLTEELAAADGVELEDAGDEAAADPGDLESHAGGGDEASEVAEAEERAVPTVGLTAGVAAGR